MELPMPLLTENKVTTLSTLQKEKEYTTKRINTIIDFIYKKRADKICPFK